MTYSVSSGMLDFTHSLIFTIAQWRSDGGAGRTVRHLLGAAKGRKTPKFFFKNSRENSDCKFPMCLHARKTKRYAGVYLSSAITLDTVVHC